MNTQFVLFLDMNEVIKRDEKNVSLYLLSNEYKDI